MLSLFVTGKKNNGKVTEMMELVIGLFLENERKERRIWA